jgi:hypothetical protein
MPPRHLNDSSSRAGSAHMLKKLASQNGAKAAGYPLCINDLQRYIGKGASTAPFLDMCMRIQYATVWVSYIS